MQGGRAEVEMRQEVLMELYLEANRNAGAR